MGPAGLVVLIAVGWEFAYAVPVSTASMLAFNWFFFAPEHTFRLRESENTASERST